MALCLSLATPAGAYEMGETFRVKFKTFSVHGSYTKRACSAQANLRSAKGQKTAFSIYWKVGKALYLMTTHPGYKKVQGKQVMEFVFPDGTGLRVPVKRTGAQVQANIGFGAQAQRFNAHIKNNRRMVVNLVGVGDKVSVDLREQGHVVAAIKACREFLQ